MLCISYIIPCIREEKEKKGQMGLFDALRSPPRQPSVEEETPSGVELGEDLSNSSSSSELLSNHEVGDVHVAPNLVDLGLRAAQ